MSRHAYLFGSIVLAGMTVGCRSVPCPSGCNAGHACACDDSPNSCNSCDSKVVNGWMVKDGGQKQASEFASSVQKPGSPSNCPSCSTTRNPVANQPQAMPEKASPDKQPGFAVDQLDRPAATPTARPRTLPPPSDDATQNPLPPIVPPRPAVELPPVPRPPSPPQQTTANKLLPPLPSGPSSKSTSPYSQVRYSPY